MGHAQRRHGVVALLTCAVLALPGPLALAHTAPGEPPAPAVPRGATESAGSPVGSSEPAEPTELNGTAESSRPSAPWTPSARGVEPPGLGQRSDEEPYTTPRAGREAGEGKAGRLAGNPAGVGRRPGRAHPGADPDGPGVPPGLDPLPTATGPDEPGDGDGDGDGSGDGDGDAPASGDRPTHPPSDGHRPHEGSGSSGHSGDSGSSGDDADGSGHQGREGREGPAAARPSHRPDTGREDPSAHDGEGSGEQRREKDSAVPPASVPPSTGRPAPRSSDQAIGKHNLYEPDVPLSSQEAGELPRQGVASEPSGEVLPVLPLGAGMALIGLGLAFLALRLRRG
ncbi:hypothetical protein [Streptomyces sp. NPDC048172]|uniref:hypothetical protein n=1 Tax=Streptomyces sp. NPDC048172 TaxID=3365505 RepID=UPI003720C37E